MSTYEDYGDVSTHYDATRVPIGVEIVLGHLAAGPGSLEDVHLLDAGCGTGSYAAALAPHVGRLTLVDASEEMLAVAVDKLAASPAAPPVTARSATLQALPFEDESFDAVMVNQVLHHLGDPTAEGDWPQHEQVLAELARVLRPGGALTVNTATHEQIRHGYWAFSLIPAGVEEMCRRYAPLGVLEALAKANGLAPAGRFVPTDVTIQGERYLDPEGPLDPAFRRGDSTWSLAPEAELQAALATLEDLRDRGELADFMARHDRRRPHIGQVTFLAARRRP